MTNSKENIHSIINHCIKHGYINQISRSDLRKAIMQALCVIDNRTIDKYEKALLAMDYMTQPRPLTYQWNYSKLSEIPTIKQLTIHQTQETLT